MPVLKHMKGLPQELLGAEGLMYQDWFAISVCQRECTTRLGIALQREQESYMTKHPEILAMMKIFIAKMTQKAKRKDFEQEAAFHFTRSFADLDEEIRIFLESPEDGPYINVHKQVCEIDDEDFMSDLKKIIMQHYPSKPWDVRAPPCPTPDTESSSFISIITSDITLPTPEPVPTPEPTISEIFYKLVSNTVDKVIYVQVDEEELLYDTAYVELMKAVEEAMEIPVIDIKVDIATLFNNAYRMFEINIAEKDRQAAAVAWEKRMRKKLKRSLRRQKNFKGYETPPTPQSDISSRKSDQRPPPRPCKCQPLANFNRYGKDRFGIYLPREKEFSKINITTTPACSSGNVTEGNDDKTDKSLSSKKSSATTRSTVSQSPASTRSTTSGKRTRATPVSDDDSS